MPPAGENLGTVVPMVSPDVKITPRGASGALCEFTARPGARRVEIDSIGVEVLSHLDGRAGAGDLIDRFARTHKLSPLESRALILTYLRALAQRGIVVMQTVEPDDAGSAEGETNP